MIEVVLIMFLPVLFWIGNSLANIDKIEKTFAWKPQMSVEEWIKGQVNG